MLLAVHHDPAEAVVLQLGHAHTIRRDRQVPALRQ
jgi:hypothetical protein